MSNCPKSAKWLSISINHVRAISNELLLLRWYDFIVFYMEYYERYLLGKSKLLCLAGVLARSHKGVSPLGWAFLVLTLTRVVGLVNKTTR